MSRNGYTGVPLAGFCSFGDALQSGAWAPITVSAGLLTGPLDTAALDRLGIFSQWKLRLERAVGAALAVGSSAQPMVELDSVWDNAQRRLELLIEVAERAPDAPTQAAGTRLRARLLPAPAVGRSQTQMAYPQEVAYGKAQILVARQPDVHADIVATGLVSVLTEVNAATRALDEGLGSTTGTTRRLTDKAEARSARYACVSVFNMVHDDMVWFLSNTADSPERTTAESLLQTLSDLLSLFPLPVPTPRTTAATTTTAPATSPNPDVTIIPAGTPSVAAITSPPAATPTAPTAAAPTPSTTAPTTAASKRKTRRASPKPTIRGKAVRKSTVKPMVKAPAKTPVVKKKTAKPAVKKKTVKKTVKKRG